jgi:hypothetical protein
MGKGKAYTGFWWENLGGKRSLGRHRLRWEDTIKKDLQVVEYGGMDWVDVAQDRNRRQASVNAVMNLWVLFPCSCFSCLNGYVGR